MVKKAQRPTQENQNGGFKEMESKIDVSNVMVVCPSCGKPAGTGKFCNHCGAPLAVNKCPNCGASVALGLKFCGECGSPMSTKKICPSCGTENDAGMKFCGECGTKL